MIELSSQQGSANGRVALVTGAARGIGLGIAAWLISEGWQVVLTDLDRARGAKVVEVMGESACFIAMDVSDEKQVAQGVAQVLGQFGRLDALVCNAAMVAWLLSKNAGFVTGQEFVVDGGMTKKMIYQE